MSSSLSARMAFPLNGGALGPLFELVHELAVQGGAELREFLHSPIGRLGQALLHPGRIEIEITDEDFQILHVGNADLARSGWLGRGGRRG